MKKLALILTLFVLNLVGMNLANAQTDLKKAFEEGRVNYDKNPAGEVKKFSDDLRFFGGEGNSANKAYTLELVNRTAAGKVQTKFSELRVKQSGTLGVVSGVRDHGVEFPNGMKMNWKDNFTYTFEWKNNAWIITDIHHTKVDYRTTPNQDELAIRNVINKETEAYLKADYTTLKSCWADKPYAERQHESLNEMVKTPFLKGEALKQTHELYWKSLKPSDKKVTITDLELHSSGDVAWVSFTQEYQKADGSKDIKERGMRILEKINGEWKIVYMSIAVFK